MPRGGRLFSPKDLEFEPNSSCENELVSFEQDGFSCEKELSFEKDSESCQSVIH